VFDWLIINRLRLRKVGIYYPDLSLYNKLIYTQKCIFMCVIDLTLS
jgi:hypothetical protein